MGMVTLTSTPPLEFGIITLEALQPRHFFSLSLCGYLFNTISLYLVLLTRPIPQVMNKTQGTIDLIKQIRNYKSNPKMTPRQQNMSSYLIF